MYCYHNSESNPEGYPYTSVPRLRDHNSTPSENRGQYLHQKYRSIYISLLGLVNFDGFPYSRVPDFFLHNSAPRGRRGDLHVNWKVQPSPLRNGVNKLLHMGDFHLRARSGMRVISLAKCASGMIGCVLR